jgi:hypothetical protein
MYLALAVGRPFLRETVVHYVVGFDAERVLDELGCAVAVVAVDGSLEKGWSWGTPSLSFKR